MRLLKSRPFIDPRRAARPPLRQITEVAEGPTGFREGSTHSENLAFSLWGSQDRVLSAPLGEADFIYSKTDFVKVER